MPANLIEKAYNAVKLKDDPDYAGVAATYKQELATRADGVDRTGVTTTPFEIKYKELSEKEIRDTPQAPLATVNAINEPSPKLAAAKTEEAPKAKAGETAKAEAKAEDKPKEK